MTTYTWTSATSGDWTTSGAWNPAGGPQNGGDAALISATGSAYTITYDDGSRQVALLDITSSNATLDFASGVLTTGTLIAAGTIDVDAGAQLSTSSAASVGAGSNLSMTINSGTVLMNGGFTLTAGSALKIEGSGGTLTESGGLSIAGGTTAEIDTGAGMQTSGALGLGGLLQTTAGTGTVSFSNISGTGTIEANGGTVVVAGSLSGATVQLDISNSASSVLDTTGALFFGNSLPVTFLGSLGEFIYSNSTDSHVTFDIAGLNAGSGRTNFIDLALNSGVTISSGGSGSGATGSVVLSNGDTLSLSGITGAATWFAKAVADGSGTDIFLSSVCYVAGTHILTATGETPIESLRPGDFVQTLAGDDLVARPIKWLGRRRIDVLSHRRPDTVAPIRIRRGAVADNIPHCDLLVSPDHAILIDGKLICARQLVNGMTIRQENGRSSVDYLHIELDSHAILFAEGLPAESYLDTGNRGFFASADGPFVLHPVVMHPDLTNAADHPTRVAASCAPFVWDEEGVRPIWQRLADRAEALGWTTRRRTTTGDPDLHIVVEGRRVEQLEMRNGRYFFCLPGWTPTVRVVSRAGSPTDTRPWIEDRRHLGVYVERIVLRAGNDVREVPVDDPGLSRGWWAVEREGTALRRWTNGDALLPLPLPLPLSSGPVVLELQAGIGAIRYVVDEAQEERAA